MSTDLARWQPPAVERLERKTVDAIANTALIPEAIRGNVPAIIATILKGRALGLDDMHALTALHWIQGKPVMGTETMVACVRRQGHSIMVEYGDGSVTAKGRRLDNGDEATVTWTREMAERAGLLSKENWRKYEGPMLWARAASQLCRVLFPDVLAGVSYTPEELELSPEEQVSEAIGVLVPPPDDGPDDSLTPGSGAAGPGPDVSDVVIDVEFEEEPEAAAVSPVGAVSPAGPPSEAESGSSSEPSSAPQPRQAGSRVGAAAEGAGELPPETVGQGSIFAEMAEKAQSKRGHRDPS